MCAKKVREWDHILINDNKRASQLARNEDELIQRSFKKALGNIHDTYASIGYPRDLMQKAIGNISAICMQILSKGESFDYFQDMYATMSTRALAQVAFDSMDIPKSKK